MTDYQIINLQQLQALLAEKNGARICTLTVITEPDLYKNLVGNNYEKIVNPYLSVKKISRVNCIINFQYSNVVNRQRDREGKEKDFVASPRLWGTRLQGLPFVSHINKNGEAKIYLEVKMERILEIEYRDDLGNVIDETLINKWLKKKETTKIKEHQGLEKEVILKDYNVKNIITINIDGIGYIIMKD